MRFTDSFYNLKVCSNLENPRDGGAWWAAIYGVAQSQTRLKRLSSSSSTIWEALEGSYLNIIRAPQVVLVVKNPPANAGDLGSIPELGRAFGRGHGNPL